MKTHSKPNRAVILSIATIALISLLSAALADELFPGRPVKIVVPLPPGPALDIVPRLIAEKLSTRWKQPVVVDNRPGAASHIGAAVVGKADPDGYTLLSTPPGPLVVSQFIYSKLGFDPTAFVPIGVMFRAPLVYVAHPDLPVSNLSELIAYAKANPDKVSFGSPGVGSEPHLQIEELMQRTGVRMTHVPYQGLGPALADLLAGHISILIDSASNTFSHISAGKLKLLAAAGDKRLAELPDAAAASETVPGLLSADWVAAVAPPKTSPELAGKISLAIADALRLPDIEQKLAALHVVGVGSSPSVASALLTSERERFRGLVARLGLKAE
jgi:tripartite-type tricarboxylate transporter receptor subunit TctC